MTDTHHDNTPQNDFYHYVNQAWLNDAKNSIPDDYSSWGGFTKLHDDGLKNQIGIVKELKKKSTLSDEEKKIHTIWAASENRFKSWDNEEADYHPIEFELNYLHNNFQSGEKQTTYVTNVVNYLYYTQVNGITNVFDFDKGNDLTQTNNIVLDLSTGGLSLPSRVYYFKDEFKDKLMKFKEHLKNVSDIINRKTTINLNSQFVEDVMEFEMSIAYYTMTPDQARNYDQYYTNTTLTDLHTDINTLTSLDDKKMNYPENDRDFKFEDHIEAEVVSLFFEGLYDRFGFREQLETNVNANFDETDDTKPSPEHITTYDGDAIRRCLATILNKKNVQKYKSYLAYKIIKKVSSFCSKELDDEFFNFYQKEVGGKNKQKDHEKRSIGIVNTLAGEMLGKQYVAQYFSEGSKTTLKHVIQKELDIMKNSLKTSDWLTSETKLKALIKLSTFNTKIGYPDKWKDYSKFNIESGDSLYTIFKKAHVWSFHDDFFDKLNSKVDVTEWYMTPQTVNAYYSPNLNEIVFPAAILQPPFFHTSEDTIDFDYSDEKQITDIENLPSDLCVLAANLGGIGAVIAHELTHGFDDQGRKFDENGNLKNWWKTEDTELFTKKCNQLKKIVSGYTYHDKNENIHKINDALTRGENLADLGGLSIALQTLKAHLNNTNLKQYTTNALRIFFRAWANIWKLNITEDNKVMLLHCDPHSPCDFRGNLVKNFEDFHTVFNVQESDNMYVNKTDRLIMW